jgi:chemotaxis protein MotB
MAEGGGKPQVRIIYKKKKGGHPFHGGSWKVALADFMTAMFALFLVMWILAQSQEVRSAVAYYFRHPQEIAGVDDVVYEGGIGVDPDARGLPKIPATIREGGASTDSAQSPGTSASNIMTDLQGDNPAGYGDTAVRPDPLHTPSDVRSFLELVENLKGLLKQDAETKQFEDYMELFAGGKGLVVRLQESNKHPMFTEGHVLTPNFSKALRILGREFGRLRAMDRINNTERWNRVEITGHGPGVGRRTFVPETQWLESFAIADLARKRMVEGGLSDKQLVAVRGCAGAVPILPESLPNVTDRTFPRRITILVYPWQWEPESF